LRNLAPGVKLDAAGGEVMAAAIDQARISDDPVEIAERMRPLLRANAARTENDRRLAPENVEALEDAGLFKVMVPKRWGGFGASINTYVRTAAALAHGCPATGWVQSITNISAWIGSHLPDRGQEEIFADSSPRICSVLSPTATARRVAGGYLIEQARWSFASGCLHSNWAGVGIPLVDENGKMVEHGIAYIPMDELEIQDDWFVAGMRGTGSNTLTAKNVLVPDHRVLSFTRALNGEWPAQRHGGEVSDRYSVMPVLAIDLVGPVIGAAEAALEAVTEGATRRGITYTTYVRQADSSVVHRNLGEAALRIDAARLHALRAAADIDAGASSGCSMDFMTRARVRADAAWTGKLLRDAIDQLASIGGAGAFADNHPVQRLWRDANVASRHAALAIGACLEIYGRAMLGVDNITAMI
jgi:alkylation response protein AidB-like acyl-CoA dehydrogenase